MASLFRPPRPQTWLFDAAAAVFFVAGLLGIIIHGSFLNVPGPGPVVYPNFLGIWLATFMAFFGLQIAWQYHVTPNQRRWKATALLVYYGAMLVIDFLLFLGYAVGYRADGAVWTLFLLFCLLINAYLAWHRYLVVQSLGTSVPSNATDSSSEAGQPAEKADAVGPRALPPAIVCWLAPFNATLLAFGLILFGFLLGGSWSQAAGWRQYPPEGEFYSISYDGGTTQVMAYCTGPRNSSLPTFIFDIGGGGHSSSDLYGLQGALNDLNRRVCTFDYPGCGWSGYAVSASQPTIVGQIIEALEEPGPFILVGTMDGGPERIYEYALNHPEDVVALIPISWGPGEFPTYQQVNNLTDAEALEYAQQTVASRLALGNLIRGLAVQWGLMSIFVSPSQTFVPAEREAEQRFLNLFTEKQWTTQAIIIASWVADPAILFVESLYARNRTLDSSIPVFMFYNDVNVTAACEERNFPINSTDCDQLFQSQQINYEFNLATTTITPGSELVVCDDCKGFMSGDDNLDWVVSEIIRVVGNITLP